MRTNEVGIMSRKWEPTLHRHTVRREPTIFSPIKIGVKSPIKTGAFSSFAFNATSSYQNLHNKNIDPHATYRTQDSSSGAFSSGVLHSDRRARIGNPSFNFTAPPACQPYTLFPTQTSSQAIAMAHSQPNMGRIRGRARVGRYIISGHNHYHEEKGIREFEQKQAKSTHSFGDSAWYPSDDIYRRPKNCLLAQDVAGYCPYLRGAETLDIKSALRDISVMDPVPR
jgi:hypothetical protein